MKRHLTPLYGCALAAALLPTGCSTVAQYGTMAGQAAGVITADQAQSINRSAVAMEKTFQDITPEQEYYIGRSVAATVLATYRPYDQAALNQYLTVLGQTLAQYSDKPETFGGYHFLVIETEEVNAFAAPGGLILVSRGLLRCCRSEDALAAVLAHEIGHVQNQHGLRAIKKGRLNAALTTLAVEAGKNLAGESLAEVTKAFEGSITDISSTLMNSGYARTLEHDADAAAVQILSRAGYNPKALVDMLGQMKTRIGVETGRGFGKTHPSPDVRIEHVRTLIGAQLAAAVPAARQRRFNDAIGMIR
ncbi:MAG TPA: M48 family metalloprotease [Kiritimatiellia bacterium]|nr:M48 family metalloprotease [Kiritimatiellia bacterium]